MCLNINPEETARLLKEDWTEMDILKGYGYGVLTPYRQKKIKAGWLKRFTFWTRYAKKRTEIHGGAIHAFPGDLNYHHYPYVLCEIWGYLKCKAYKKDFIAAGNFEGVPSLCFKKIWIPQEELAKAKVKFSSGNPRGYF